MSADTFDRHSPFDRVRAVPSSTPCTVAHPHMRTSYEYICAVCGKRIAAVSAAEGKDT